MCGGSDREDVSRILELMSFHSPDIHNANLGLHGPWQLQRKDMSLRGVG